MTQDAQNATSPSTNAGGTVAAHSQVEDKKYTILYPAHSPRENDPHQKAFDAFKRSHKATGTCWYADQIGTTDKCAGGLELHHFCLEYAMVNAVDITLIDKSFPDAGSTQDEIDQWAQSSPENLVFLCEYHHRGLWGVHVVSYADWKASLIAPSIAPG